MSAGLNPYNFRSVPIDPESRFPADSEVIANGIQYDFGAARPNRILKSTPGMRGTVDKEATMRANLMTVDGEVPRDLRGSWSQDSRGVGSPTSKRRSNSAARKKRTSGDTHAARLIETAGRFAHTAGGFGGHPGELDGVVQHFSNLDIGAGTPGDSMVTQFPLYRTPLTHPYLPSAAVAAQALQADPSNPTPMNPSMFAASIDELRHAAAAVHPPQPNILGRAERERIERAQAKANLVTPSEEAKGQIARYLEESKELDRKARKAGGGGVVRSERAEREKRKYEERVAKLESKLLHLQSDADKQAARDAWEAAEAKYRSIADAAARGSKDPLDLFDPDQQRDEYGVIPPADPAARKAAHIKQLHGALSRGEILGKDFIENLETLKSTHKTNLAQVEDLYYQQKLTQKLGQTLVQNSVQQIELLPNEARQRLLVQTQQQQHHDKKRPHGAQQQAWSQHPASHPLEHDDLSGVTDPRELAFRMGQTMRKNPRQTAAGVADSDDLDENRNKKRLAAMFEPSESGSQVGHGDGSIPRRHARLPKHSHADLYSEDEDDEDDDSESEVSHDEFGRPRWREVRQNEREEENEEAERRDADERRHREKKKNKKDRNTDGRREDDRDSHRRSRHPKKDASDDDIEAVSVGSRDRSGSRSRSRSRSRSASRSRSQSRSRSRSHSPKRRKDKKSSRSRSRSPSSARSRSRSRSRSHSPTASGIASGLARPRSPTRSEKRAAEAEQARAERRARRREEKGHSDASNLSEYSEEEKYPPRHKPGSPRDMSRMVSDGRQTQSLEQQDAARDKSRKGATTATGGRTRPQTAGVRQSLNGRPSTANGRGRSASRPRSAAPPVDIDQVFPPNDHNARARAELKAAQSPINNAHAFGPGRVLLDDDGRPRTSTLRRRSTSRGDRRRDDRSGDSASDSDSHLRRSQRLTEPQPFGVGDGGAGVAGVAGTAPSRTKQRLLEYLGELRAEEEEHTSKVFKANPLPVSTLEPRYEKMKAEARARSKQIRRERAQLTQAMVKPFEFAASKALEERKKKKKKKGKDGLLSDSDVDDSVSASGTDSSKVGRRPRRSKGSGTDTENGPSGIDSNDDDDDRSTDVASQASYQVAFGFTTRKDDPQRRSQVDLQKRLSKKTNPHAQKFKANKIPWTSQVNMLDSIIREREKLREERVRERAKALLEASALPQRMEEHKKRSEKEAEKSDQEENEAQRRKRRSQEKENETRKHMRAGGR